PSLKIGLKFVEFIEYKFNILTSNLISYDRQVFFIFAINKAWFFLINNKILAGCSGQSGLVRWLHTVYSSTILFPLIKLRFLTISSAYYVLTKVTL
ncbi:hypothetical protein CXC99_13160, partial [Salmonella enterica subsp. enterica serovar Weltevreden]|nr:hypothetical protein [Salmonella enterica subsp. enterica serovar Weltevreden]